MPYPWSGPRVSSVFKTIRARVPCQMSTLGSFIWDTNSTAPYGIAIGRREDRLETFSTVSPSVLSRRCVHAESPVFRSPLFRGLSRVVPGPVSRAGLPSVPHRGCPLQERISPSGGPADASALRVSRGRGGNSPGLGDERPDEWMGTGDRGGPREKRDGCAPDGQAGGRSRRGGLG